MTVVMHEKSSPVRHESRILVSLLPIFVMLPTLPSRGPLRGVRHGRRAHDNRVVALGRCWCSFLLFCGRNSTRETHAIELCLNFRNPLGDLAVGLGRSGVGLPMAIVLGCSTATGSSLEGGRRGRRLVDIARVTIIGVVVVFRNDRALCARVVVEMVECLGTSLVIAVIIDAAPMAKGPPADAFGGACHVECSAERSAGVRDKR